MIKLKKKINIHSNIPGNKGLEVKLLLHTVNLGFFLSLILLFLLILGEDGYPKVLILEKM